MWFDIYSFISLLLFNKNNTWRPTCFIVQTTGFNRDLFSRDPTFTTSGSSSTVFAVNLIRFQ